MIKFNKNYFIMILKLYKQKNINLYSSTNFIINYNISAFSCPSSYSASSHPSPAPSLSPSQ